ncbi:MAG: DUF6228 family protein [Cyanobacteria bacterium J06638_6]
MEHDGYLQSLHPKVNDPQMIQLKSSNSDVVLKFSDVSGDYFQVALDACDHSASRQVYAYTDPWGIARLFSTAAKQWKGWEGHRVWESLEGELRLDLSIDRLGHVTLEVRIQSDPGGPDPWEHRAELTLEAGQLAAIARAMVLFWSVDDELSG